MNDEVYIYGLKCPETDAIRYIGKSKTPKKRYASHIFNAKHKPDNIHLSRWILRLKKNNQTPLLVIIETTELINWKEREKYWISFYFGNSLCNKNEGGIEPPDNTGFKWSDEQKSKHNSHKRKGIPQWENIPHPLLGKEHPAKGQKRSKEFCNLMSKQRTENNGMRGVKLSEERIEQIKNKVRKPIVLIDNNGVILKRFNSQKETSIELGIDSGNISKVCNGKLKHIRNYIFIWA